MHKLPKAGDVDLTRYAPGLADPETMYGLPQQVRFCASCVISNQRPNSAVEFKHTRESKKATIHFDAEGVCDACRVAAQKHTTIDWEQREKELARLCDRYRRDDGHYDVLVPGSGGKDSFYAAHVLKYRYGMHPLTCTWAPHIYTEWGWRNHQAWIHAGFDNILFTPNARVHRLLTRLAVENLFHPFQPFILGQKQLAPKLAVLHDIPFVVYGENEAEYGNPIQDTESARRSFEYFARDDSEVFLGGESIAALKQSYGLETVDLEPYMPADPRRLAEKNVQVHYLGYYLKWHPQSCYYYAVEHGGFQAAPERTPGTYSKYNSIDDRIDDFHYFTTRIKFGIGRATYDAAQEIRSRDITREEGVALVKRFDHEFPERFADEIFRYLSIPPREMPEAARMFEQPMMDRDYFMRLANRFRPPHLWASVDGEWKLRRTVFDGRG